MAGKYGNTPVFTEEQRIEGMAKHAAAMPMPEQVKFFLRQVEQRQGRDIAQRVRQRARQLWREKIEGHTKP